MEESKKLGHLMIDLEALGTSSNSVITSIAAVEFDLKSGEVGKSFYHTIDIQSCLDLNMTVDGSAIAFWLAQPDEARLELLKDTKNLKEVLYLFRKFIETLGAAELMVWGNGSRFDLGLLHDAYRLSKSGSIPWNLKNERDVRTRIMDHLDVKHNMEFIGVKHHPIDDCLHQIKYMNEVYKVKK